MPVITPQVPEGLIDLMKDLAKNVIKENPENIYKYAALHFEKLIIERDGCLDKGYEGCTARDKRFEGRAVFEVTNSNRFVCRRPQETTQQTAHDEYPINERYIKAIFVIQRFFRRLIMRKREQRLTQQSAAFIIQRTLRSFVSRKRRVVDETDNVSEAASYTSSSTVRLLSETPDLLNEGSRNEEDVLGEDLLDKSVVQLEGMSIGSLSARSGRLVEVDELKVVAEGELEEVEQEDKADLENGTEKEEIIEDNIEKVNVAEVDEEKKNTNEVEDGNNGENFVKSSSSEDAVVADEMLKDSIASEKREEDLIIKENSSALNDKEEEGVEKNKENLIITKELFEEDVADNMEHECEATSTIIDEEHSAGQETNALNDNGDDSAKKEEENGTKKEPETSTIKEEGHAEEESLFSCDNCEKEVANSNDEEKDVSFDRNSSKEKETDINEETESSIYDNKSPLPSEESENFGEGIVDTDIKILKTNSLAKESVDEESKATQKSKKNAVDENDIKSNLTEIKDRASNKEVNEVLEKEIENNEVLKEETTSVLNPSPVPSTEDKNSPPSADVINGKCVCHSVSKMDFPKQDTSTTVDAQFGSFSAIGNKSEKGVDSKRKSKLGTPAFSAFQNKIMSNGQTYEYFEIPGNDVVDKPDSNPSGDDHEDYPDSLNENLTELDSLEVGRDVDVDEDDSLNVDCMDKALAAVTIQKWFRGYTARKAFMLQKSRSLDREADRTFIVSKHDSTPLTQRFKSKLHKTSKSLDLLESELLHKSATTIQNAFKDYKVRKENCKSEVKEDMLSYGENSGNANLDSNASRNGRNVSVLAPTAPLLDEIDHVEETNGKKALWYVGDELIEPSCSSQERESDVEQESALSRAMRLVNAEEDEKESLEKAETQLNRVSELLTKSEIDLLEAPKLTVEEFAVESGETGKNAVITSQIEHTSNESEHGAITLPLASTESMRNIYQHISSSSISQPLLNELTSKISNFNPSSVVSTSSLFELDKRILSGNILNSENSKSVSAGKEDFKEEINEEKEDFGSFEMGRQVGDYEGCGVGDGEGLEADAEVNAEMGGKEVENNDAKLVITITEVDDDDGNVTEDEHASQTGLKDTVDESDDENSIGQSNQKEEIKVEPIKPTDLEVQTEETHSNQHEDDLGSSNKIDCEAKTADSIESDKNGQQENEEDKSVVVGALSLDEVTENKVTSMENTAEENEDTVNIKEESQMETNTHTSEDVTNEANVPQNEGSGSVRHTEEEIENVVKNEDKPETVKQHQSSSTEEQINKGDNHAVADKSQSSVTNNEDTEDVLRNEESPLIEVISEADDPQTVGKFISSNEEEEHTEIVINEEDLEGVPKESLSDEVTNEDLSRTKDVEHEIAGVLLQAQEVFKNDMKDMLSNVINEAEISANILQQQSPCDDKDEEEEVTEVPCVKRKLSLTFLLPTTTDSDQSSSGEDQSSPANAFSDMTEEEIEKIDITKFDKDSLEAMYFSLKKNEIMVDRMQRRASEHKIGSNEDGEGVLLAEPTYDPVKPLEEVEMTSQPRKLFKKMHTVAGDRIMQSDSSEELDEPMLHESLDDITRLGIREKMMAYSMSEADSDCFDVNQVKPRQDDFNISTALEPATSTDTDSTIISAATKIQAGARGFLTRRKLRRASEGAKSSISERRASFGNEAISESLENLIEEESAKKIQKFYRSYRNRKNTVIIARHLTEDDDQPPITFEGRLAARRLTLQRGAAVQKDSSPDEENAEKKSAAVSKVSTEAARLPIRWMALRQNSMPVQIKSEVLRVMPKHMRKRIRSAEENKKKRRSLMK